MEGQLNSESTGKQALLPGPRHRTRQATTYRGGLACPAHRWFRLTPSFSPELVSGLLAEFAGPKTRVLDPFSGRGTTPIQCQLQNVRCTGVEINPVLHFAGRVSLNWQVDQVQARETHRKILAGAKRWRKSLASMSACDISLRLKVGFPQIRNVERWWREDVLRDLLMLKAAIHKHAPNVAIRELFLLALGNILLDAANITLGRLQLHFIDRSDDKIDTMAIYTQAAQVVLDDLSALQELPVEHHADIHRGDTRFLSSLVGREKFDLVITSPPYPNRYSYVWNTRPHLYFLDMFAHPKEAAVLDCTTIGGTWGRATTRHAKGEFTYSDPRVESVVGAVVAEIRAKDLLMSNYVAMYFDDLHRHILELKKALSPGAVCAYVVGNSRIKKSLVETEQLLSQLFQSAGFKEIRLEQIRKRNSGKGLFETIVIVQSD